MKKLLTVFCAFIAVCVCVAHGVNDDDLSVPFDSLDYNWSPSAKPIAGKPTYNTGLTYILKHHGFTVSWNPVTKNPQWVAWMLTKDRCNAIYKRPDTFYPDPLLPRQYRVQSVEYAGTGYDRGHMCPAADMEYSLASLNDCFYMSNICPQNKYLNRRYWLQLESACRTWAKQEDTIYITCGPYYDDTTNIKTIWSKKHEIYVPAGFFKCVMSLRKGHEKAIGFFYQNNALAQSIQDNAVSVDSVEKATGIDFFPNTPADIQNRIEATYNLSDWDN